MEISAKEASGEETKSADMVVSMDVDVSMSSSVAPEAREEGGHDATFNWAPFPCLKIFWDREKENYSLNEDIFVKFLLELMRRDVSVKDDYSLQRWCQKPRKDKKSIISAVECVGMTIMVVEDFSKETLPQPMKGATTTTNVKPSQKERLLINGEYKKEKYDVLGNFVKFLKHCVFKFHGHKEILENSYKGPFASLIQSSGMGKTRLALECATQENMHVLYICLRASVDTGYPPRTTRIADYILHANKQGLRQEFWICLYTAMLWCYSKSVLSGTSETRIEWLKGVATNNDHSNFWGDVIGVCNALMNGRDVWMDDGTNLTLQKLIKTLPPKDHFLVVFDEAAVLATDQELPSSTATLSATATAAATSTEIVSILNRIRETLRIVGRVNLNVFGLFIDTMSSIQNLYPPDVPKKITPSYRLEDKPKLVFPAFCMLPLCNLSTPSNMKIVPLTYEVNGSDVCVTVHYHSMRIALLSRPLFAMSVAHMYHDTDSFGNSADLEARYIDREISLAMQKLINDKDIFPKVSSSSDSSDDAILAKVALLSVKFCLSSTSALHRQMLIRKHMATCYGTGEDGEMIARYQSEPFLAEAATKALLKENVFENCLKELYNLSVRGGLLLPSGKGEMGELVACIALSRAFDKTCQRLGVTASPVVASVNCRPVPLLEVLVELYGPGSREEVLALLTGNALMTGVVMFNHFIKLRNQVTSVDGYQQLLKGGTAVLCQNGQAAIDIVIPVALPIQTGKAVDLWDFQSYTLTWWEIQVKNWTSPFNLKTLVDDMVKIYTVDAMDPHFLDKITVLETSSTKTRSTSYYYSVPVLYMAINTGCDQSTSEEEGSLGRTFDVDTHWGVHPQTTDEVGGLHNEEEQVGKKRKLAAHASESEPAKGKKGKKLAAVAADTCQATAAHPSGLALVSKQESKLNAGKKATSSRTAKYQVIGLQLCGIQNMAVFNATEKALVEQLLRPPDETVPLRKLLTNYGKLNEIETADQVESLEPYISRHDDT